MGSLNAFSLTFLFVLHAATGQPLAGPNATFVPVHPGLQNPFQNYFKQMFTNFNAMAIKNMEAHQAHAHALNGTPGAVHTFTSNSQPQHGGKPEVMVVHKHEMYMYEVDGGNKVNEHVRPIRQRRQSASGGGGGQPGSVIISSSGQGASSNLAAQIGTGGSAVINQESGQSSGGGSSSSPSPPTSSSSPPPPPTTSQPPPTTSQPSPPTTSASPPPTTRPSGLIEILSNQQGPDSNLASQVDNANSAWVDQHAGTGK